MPGFIDANDHRTANYSDVFGRLVLVREFTGNSPATYDAPTRATAMTPWVT